MYNIINLKIFRHKLTASGNVQAILNYKLVRPVSILRLPKKQKQVITAKTKKMSKKSVEAIKK